MRAILCALLLCSALPAVAADSQAPYPDPLDGMKIIRGTPIGKSPDTLIQMRTKQGTVQDPYLDPCQCVRGKPIPPATKPVDTLIRGRAPTGIYDPATTIRGEAPKPDGEEKPDRPIGIG